MGVRSILTALTFRAGGDFLTSYGSPVEYDNAILQAKVGEKCKEDFMGKGIFIDEMSTSDGAAYTRAQPTGDTARWRQCSTGAMETRKADMSTM